MIGHLIIMLFLRLLFSLNFVAFFLLANTCCVGSFRPIRDRHAVASLPPSIALGDVMDGGPSLPPSQTQTTGITSGF